MKPIIALTIFITLVGTALQAQDKNPDWKAAKGQPLRFNTLIHDFGTLTQGDKAEFKFEFINDTVAVLAIQHVTTSCGCTTPSYSKRPVKGKHKGSINVKYDSERLGQFSKTVFIYTNFSLEPVELRITGKVLSQEEKSALKDGDVSKQPANLKTTLPK